MGGFGSTRWNLVNTKDTVEANRSLDINKLNRDGCLRPGYRGVWQFTLNGEPVGRIHLRRDDALLRISYRIRQCGGEWRDIEQPTPIVWAPCRFGGARPYFACPGIVNGMACAHWVTKLYNAGSYFLCRHCYRLAYSSRRENRYDRALRRANKTRMRLGGEPGIASLFPDRPKGMHKRTYERLQSKISDAEMLANERLAIFVEQLQRRDHRIISRSHKEFWT